MADNFITNVGVGGPSFRAVDKGGHLRSVIMLDGGAGGAESLIQGDNVNGLDVDLTRTPKASGSGGGVILVPSGTTTQLLAAANAQTLKMREIQNFNEEVTFWLKFGSGGTAVDFHRVLVPLTEWWTETYYGIITAYQTSGVDQYLAVAEFT